MKPPERVFSRLVVLLMLAPCTVLTVLVLFLLLFWLTTRLVLVNTAVPAPSTPRPATASAFPRVRTMLVITFPRVGPTLVSLTSCPVGIPVNGLFRMSLAIGRPAIPTGPRTSLFLLRWREMLLL